jgi:threonine dehydrogenase-like Zn-dependent dehydrogenase
MAPDTLWPIAAVIKNLTIQFSSDGGPGPFKTVLDSLADGSIAAQSLVTAQVGLDGAAQMFDELEGSSEHVKVLVRPDLD